LTVPIFANAHLFIGLEFRQYGYAGSGFSEKGLKDAVERMKPLFIDKCPFVNPPGIKSSIAISPVTDSRTSGEQNN